MCKIYDLATQTQGQGHNSRSCDLLFNCVRSISPKLFKLVSSYFIYMFPFVRQCAEPMTQLQRLKVKVTVQGHRLYPCFVCFVALRPKSTAMVMAGRSVHLSTLYYWASLNKQLTSTSCTYFRL